MKLKVALLAASVLLISATQSFACVAPPGGDWFPPLSLQQSRNCDVVSEKLDEMDTPYCRKQLLVSKVWRGFQGAFRNT